MGESRFLEMRRQLEENNHDIQDFLGDLSKWRLETERKKAKLQAEYTKDKDLPPIRNALHEKRKQKCAANDFNCKSNLADSVRIKSYDYKSWDAFDVEKALEAIDKSESEKSPSESDTDEDLENERRIKLADVEKEQGNIRFKEGKYEDAVEHYTAAIRLAPENPLLYSNRALALCKLERFASAEVDCSTALSIDPKLVKALYRRAHARKAINKLDDAVSDLKRILDIEPRNSVALKDLSVWTGESDLGLGSVNSVFKLVDISGVVSNGLCRIPISEANGKAQGKLQRSIYEESQVDGNQSTLKSPQDSDGGVVHIESSPQSAVIPTISKEPPSNWFQMERGLRELIPPNQNLSPTAVDYLCSLDPKNYAFVIGNNLNSSCLSRILLAISMNSKLGPAQKADRLAALTKLYRFDMTWLMASDEDRIIAERILQEVPPSDLHYLKKYFT